MRLFSTSGPGVFGVFGVFKDAINESEHATII
jgi:hypothetical protein